MIINGLPINAPQGASQFTNKLSGISIKPAVHVSSGLPVNKPSIAISASTLRQDSLQRPTPMAFEVFTGDEEVSNASKLLGLSLRSSRQMTGFDNPLLNITSRFSELLTRTSPSQKEDIRSYSTFTTDGSTTKPNMTGFEDRTTDTEQKLKLSLTTKDGDTITFNVRHYTGDGNNLAYQNNNPEQRFVQAGFSGIEIDFSVDGDLSKSELKELQKFASSLNTFSNDLLQRGEMELETLDLSGLSLLSDMSLSISGPRGSLINVDYKNDEAQRSLSVNYAGSTSTIDIDKAGQLFKANTEASKQALRHYLLMIEENGKAAGATKLQNELAADVFKIAMTESAIKPDNDLKAGDVLKPKHKQLEERAYIALPDFDFEFNSLKSMPNITNRAGEVEGYDLKLSLKSQQHRIDNIVATKQKQMFELTGGKFDPLPHLTFVDLENQNYKYTSFNVVAEKTIETRSDETTLLSALVSQMQESSIQSQTYSEGKLIDSDNQQNQSAELQDIKEKLTQIEQLEQTETRINKEILDVTILQLERWW